jgi:hypothetical protein
MELLNSFIKKFDVFHPVVQIITINKQVTVSKTQFYYTDSII